MAASASNGCARTQVRTFTATDACGNTATTSRTVSWIEDITPPVFTGNYNNVTLGCAPGTIDASLGSATATDACGAVTITSSDGSITSNGCARTQVRTFTATDACGNTATTSRTVSWIEDITPPVFTGNYNNVTLGCAPGTIDASLGSATATDACGAVTITSSDGSISSNGCARTQVRTFTATDACGNTATTSRTVSWIEDITPPVFTGNYNNVTLGCAPGTIDASLGSATATDACGAVTITSSDGSISSNGCARTQVRTFTATDACGNTATTSRTVSWIEDITPPVFTGNYNNVTLGCAPGTIDASLGSATATDACGAVTITSSDGSITSNGCARTQVRTFTATDACGNTATTSRTVSWIEDITPPVFTGNYNNVTLGCAPGTIDASLGSATATDACGAVTITSSDGSITSNGCARTQVRTFTATDACGNTATTSRTVSWIEDITPPVFTGNYNNVTLGCAPGTIDASLGSATATDACGAVTITSSDGSISSNGCARTQVRTFTATDACGNTATTSRTVSWIEDITPPVFTGNYNNVTLGCAPGTIDASLGSATATDACGAVTITSSDGSISSNGCARTQVRTFTATDACGNTATTSRTVSWIEDITPPVFTGNYNNVTLGCAPGTIDASLGSATATDACGAVTITSSDGSISF